MSGELEIIAVYAFSNFPAGFASLFAAGWFCVIFEYKKTSIIKGRNFKKGRYLWKR